MKNIFILLSLLIASATVSADASKTRKLTSKQEEQLKKALRIEFTADQVASRRFSKNGFEYGINNPPPISSISVSDNISVHVSRPLFARSQNGSGHVTSTSK